MLKVTKKPHWLYYWHLELQEYYKLLSGFLRMGESRLHFGGSVCWLSEPFFNPLLLLLSARVTIFLLVVLNLFVDVLNCSKSPIYVPVHTVEFLYATDAPSPMLHVSYPMPLLLITTTPDCNGSSLPYPMII